MTPLPPRTAISAAGTPGDARCLHRITRPAWYCLTGDVVGAARKSGIRIECDHVVLDLMGFTLSGAPHSGNGISTGGAYFGYLAVANGFLENWSGAGIELLGSPHCVTNVYSRNNGRFGIYCNNRFQTWRVSAADSASFVGVQRHSRNSTPLAQPGDKK